MWVGLLEKLRQNFKFNEKSKYSENKKWLKKRNEQNKIRLNWLKKQTTNQIARKNQNKANDQSDRSNDATGISSCQSKQTTNQVRELRAIWLERQVGSTQGRKWGYENERCQSSAFLDSDWTFAFFLESDWSFAFSASWAEFLSSLFLHFSHLSRILFIFLSQIHYDFRSKCVEFWDPRDWFGLSNRHIQGHGINHNFIFFSSVWLWK